MTVDDLEIYILPSMQARETDSCLQAPDSNASCERFQGIRRLIKAAIDLEICSYNLTSSRFNNFPSVQKMYIPLILRTCTKFTAPKSLRAMKEVTKVAVLQYLERTTS